MSGTPFEDWMNAFAQYILTLLPDQPLHARDTRVVVAGVAGSVRSQWETQAQTLQVRGPRLLERAELLATATSCGEKTYFQEVFDEHPDALIVIIADGTGACWFTSCQLYDLAAVLSPAGQA